MKTAFNKFLAILMLPVISWLFINAAINQHSHILYNGEIITHAHLYTADKNTKSPFQSHSHSKATLFILSTISHPAIIFATIVAVLSIELFQSESILFSTFVKSLQKLFYNSRNYRGPPAISCF